MEAGLRGEWLAPSFDLDGGEGAGFQEEIDPMTETRAVEEQEKKLEEEGWQDLDEYQKEQSDIEGEIAPRVTAVQEVDIPMPIDVDVPEKKVDKDARKAAKKAKRDQEKKARSNKKGAQ